MSLSVMSYNIREGGRGRLNAIEEVIESRSPDLVAILEANSQRYVTRLARELGMEIAIGHANSKFHVAWISRLPIQRSRNHRLPALSKTLLEIEIEWDGAPLHLFAAHLAGGTDSVHPAEEMPVILDVVRQCAGQPHLLVGDLNALHPEDPVGPTPIGSEPMRESIDADPRLAIRTILDAGYQDCFRNLNTQDPGYTFPTGEPWLRLDYIFASPELASHLEASGTITDKPAICASDHYPVWARFT